jgi:hypothetical protein
LESDTGAIKLKARKRKCGKVCIARKEAAASPPRNKAQRNVIREKHFQGHNRSTIVTHNDGNSEMLEAIGEI